MRANTDTRPTCSASSVDAGVARDGARGRGIVAGDHHHADARAPAFAHRLRHRFAQRIGETHHAEQLAAHLFE
jgi:hypothetical protein